MYENKKNPENEPKKPDTTEQQGGKLDIGNDMSVGSGNSHNLSDFDPEKDFPETEEKEHRDGAGHGDDQRSDDNGINPTPGEINPQKLSFNNTMNVENADTDKLNPYPDEFKRDDDDERING